jgi:hypothetical protein
VQYCKLDGFNFLQLENKVVWTRLNKSGNQLENLAQVNYYKNGKHFWTNMLFSTQCRIDPVLSQIPAQEKYWVIDGRQLPL